jgi:lipid II:glycine glycyltransferase (peptidoglycan interpeptide bridge formation enzyme)
MNYKFEIDSISEEEWNDTIQGFSDATIYQTWTYGSVRWGLGNIRHAVLKRGEEIVAMAQVTVRKIPFLKAGVAYIPWGPLWLRKGEIQNKEIFKAIIVGLKNEYNVRKGYFLRVAPRIYEGEDNDIREYLEEEGFVIQNDVRVYKTILLDLSRPLEEIRKTLNPKWRNKLTQSEKNQLEVEEGNTDEIYSKYHNLQKELLIRKGYKAGVDYEEFGRIQKKLPDTLKMKVIVCNFGGEPVSAAVCTAIGDTGIYILGATGDKGLELKGSYLLQWRIIKWLKEKGCRWYDLGGINPEANPGVYQFKAGLGGRMVSQLGNFEMQGNRMSALLLNGAEQMKKLKK